MGRIYPYGRGGTDHPPNQPETHLAQSRKSLIIGGVRSIKIHASRVFALRWIEWLEKKKKNLRSLLSNYALACIVSAGVLNGGGDDALPPPLALIRKLIRRGGRGGRVYINYKKRGAGEELQQS